MIGVFSLLSSRLVSSPVTLTLTHLYRHRHVVDPLLVGVGGLGLCGLGVLVGSVLLHHILLLLLLLCGCLVGVLVEATPLETLLLLVSSPLRRLSRL